MTTIKADEQATGAAQDPAVPVGEGERVSGTNPRRTAELLRIARARLASNPADNCLRAFVQSIERQASRRSGPEAA